jgi:DNA-binding MarR family transcriptional regulator
VWRSISDLLMSDETHDRFHRACEAIGLSPPFYKALMGLQPGEPRTMRSLAEELGCDASWVTTLVDGLEERGYVARQVNPTDRRVKSVVLTTAGEQAKLDALELIHEPPARLDRLTVDELRRLRTLLAKLIDEG